MQIDVEIFKSLIGRSCISASHREDSFDWVFAFENETSLTVECLWRIVADKRLALSSEDNGQKFGHSIPVDGGRLALELIGNCSIGKVNSRQETGDLFIEFENGVHLEILSTSSGYEAWQFCSPVGSVVAMGGGGFTIFRNSDSAQLEESQEAKAFSNLISGC
jgi:hypothetical protein